MSVVIEQEPEVELKPSSDGIDMPPIYGRCPVCNKALRPHDKITGELKAPPVGQGYNSRAICTNCGTILVYVGGGEWQVWDQKTDRVPND